MVEVIKTFCCRLCGGACGILVHVDGGKIARVEGDPNVPFNKSFICSKGRALPELLYHPDRLKFPLKRIGKKGKNKWQQISMDEALTTIAQKLKGCMLFANMPILCISSLSQRISQTKIYGKAHRLGGEKEGDNNYGAKQTCSDLRKTSCPLPLKRWTSCLIR